VRNAVIKAAPLIAAATLLAACGRGEQKPKAPPAVPAKVLQVAPQRVPIAVEAVGQVQGSREIEVRARVSGILLKRLYSEGALVRAGAPLFQIDPVPFDIALAQARAQLAQEQARNEQARREAQRLTKLVAEKAISQKEFDDASSTLKLSDASLAAAAANVRQAELNLSYTRVTAPESGVTGRMLRSEGSLITAGQDSALLTTILQVEPIWVRFSLAETDLAKLPEGKLDRNSKVDVRLVLPDGAMYPGKGRLNFAATQIDARLATQELRAEFDNAKVQLLPGQFVRVQLVAGERDNVFLVPQAAVLQNEKGFFLFVLDKANAVEIRPVRPGDWAGTDWAILGGLKAGDRVVVDNLLKLRPGATVQPAEPKPEAKPPATAPAK